jgi:preprotein translocase subunit Sec63
MFAKQAQFALAAVALSLASGAFAQTAQRNVFDTETDLRMPAASSANGLTREQVQAAYIASRDAKGISEFNPHAWYFAQNNDSAPALMALFSKQKAETKQTASTVGSVSREQVRADVLAARANGQLNPFDTETDLRVPASVRQPAPTALAQR